MERKASAVWQGDLKSGKGSISTASGVLSKTQYSFGTRFEQGVGTNPEELIAAAHAGCFSMALAAGLGKGGFNPESVRTTAKVHLEKQDAGFAITRIELDTEAKVPGIDNAKFQEFADGAKKGCPVSKALAGAQISLNARLL